MAATPAKKIKEIELSAEMKELFNEGYTALFERYNEHVKDSLDDLTETKSLLKELYSETKTEYDKLGTKNIGIKTEMGKILTDLIKARNSITKDFFGILDKSTTSMTQNLKTLEGVAKKGDSKNSEVFSPKSQLSTWNSLLLKKED